MGEFELISRYFHRPAVRSPLGVGDDCALLQPGTGMHLAVSCDMLVEGRHFLSTVDPARLGHKALAVNLSDLAACGAKPLAFTLALSLPQADAAWLEPFSCGMLALADAHGCELVGGDTTKGPLNICVTVFGEVPVGRALLRSGAGVGDDVWVSGHVGDARVALEVFRGTLAVSTADFEAVRARMEQPTPRVALGQALRGVATAAIDISDGLAGDLAHLLRRSGVGARLDMGALLSLMQAGPLCVSDEDQRLEFVVSGGDDYELLFTAPPAARANVEAAGVAAQTRVTRIGVIETQLGLRIADAKGQILQRAFTSFDHFA